MAQKYVCVGLIIQTKIQCGLSFFSIAKTALATDNGMWNWRDGCVYTIVFNRKVKQEREREQKQKKSKRKKKKEWNDESKQDSTISNCWAA